MLRASAVEQPYWQSEAGMKMDSALCNIAITNFDPVNVIVSHSKGRRYEPLTERVKGCEQNAGFALFS